MRLIKVIYNDGSNGLVKVHRKAKQNRKKPYEMTAQEITATGCGIFY